MNNDQNKQSGQSRGQHPLSGQRRKDDKPWYKQFWPWFIIALPLSSVVASFTVLWLAISNPDHEVLNAEQNQKLHKGLKAQHVAPAATKKTPEQQDSASN